MEHPETPPEEVDVDRTVKELVTGDSAALSEYIATLPGDALTHAVSRLDDDERCDLLGRIEPEAAADVLELLPEAQAITTLDRLPADVAARIVHELPSDEQADFIAEMKRAEEVLAELEPEEAEGIRSLTEWPEDSAGGIMVTEFHAFPMDATVVAVVQALQEAAEEGEQESEYVYVHDDQERLVGVLRLRDLVLSRRSKPIGEIMIPDPISVVAETPLHDLSSLFDAHAFLGVPTVDAEGRLLGVVTRTGVDEAEVERSESVYRSAQGIVGGDELRSMPLVLRSRRRLAWLSLNILLNVAAASVIAAHQDTLQAVIALAVFLPIISDMSGCSGNQAVAVSMRELALNVTRPGDVLGVLWKELSVGLVNGVVLGLLLGGAAWLWQRNAWLGLVVGAALMANTLIAVAIGGTIPLLLKGLKLDPALASGPILTTVTDICGFMLLLSLTAALIAKIG